MGDRTLPPLQPLPARFWAKVRQEGDCWVWTGSLSRDGYGCFNLGNGRTANAVHRLTFEELRAPIPPGLVIDHLCRNRACVNPWHLDPVTNAVNTQRGLVSEANAARNRNHGTCKAGVHEWTEANHYRTPSTGKVRCRACAREYMRLHYLRRKGAA